MRYRFKFEKIMMVKEREKDEALSVYNDSVKRFEDVAEKLYESLKKKEDLENYQSLRLENGLPVQEIRHHQHFILNLQKTIDHFQKMVMNARNQMNFYCTRCWKQNTATRSAMEFCI